MTTIEITSATKVTMLKHLVAGKDLDLVATLTRVPRDIVLDVVSNHGYPKIHQMEWSIDVLTKGGDKIPVLPATSRRGTPLDESADLQTMGNLGGQRSGSLAITPPATIAHIPPATADLLHQGKQSVHPRTRNLAAKISALLADLTARLADEHDAVEAKAQAARESARIASRIATLQAEIDKLKGKRTSSAKSAVSSPPRSYTQKTGEFACTDPSCDRVFTTIQGAVTHCRRAHEGFNPTRKAIA
jgi:hypothetical protein